MPAPSIAIVQTLWVAVGLLLMLCGDHAENGMLAHQLSSNWAADVHMVSLHEDCVAEHRRTSHVTQQVVQVQFDGIRGVGDRHDGRQSDERA